MITENFLGWFTLLFIFLVTVFISKKYPETTIFLLLALFLRSFCVILDQYFITLVGSTGDAIGFEKKAFFYSQEFGLRIILDIFKLDSYFLSRFISIPYTLFERSEFMAKMFSVGIGTFTVFLIYQLTLIIWDKRTALKAGWFASLFPTLILYSSLILREVYICFFLVYTLTYCVNFINDRRLIYFIKLLLGFFIVSLFHGPMILGFFVFLIYLLIQILKENNFFIRFKKKNIFYIFLLPILLLPIITYFLGYYSIPKIGNFKDFGKIKDGNKVILGNIQKKLIWKIDKATRSSNNNDTGAKFPSWTIPKDTKELIYLTPIRMFYFLYSPFPWDTKKVVHLLGLFDSFLYIYLSYCILRNRKILYENPQTRFLIMILITYVFIYSLGVGNFGTSIRHRLKFIGLLIAIAAPKILRIRFNKIKKKF